MSAPREKIPDPGGENLVLRVTVIKFNNQTICIMMRQGYTPRDNCDGANTTRYRYAKPTSLAFRETFTVKRVRIIEHGGRRCKGQPQ